MPRTARDKDNFGVFYVHQESNPKGELFRNDDDRGYFLEVLKKAQQKFEFKLYGYCLLSSNAYHLILDVNGGDLSNIMKSINIRYAMYRKCSHPIFKDRYKSQFLETDEEVQKKIKAINKKSVSQFNSYCHYDESAPIRLDWIAPLKRGNAGNTTKDHKTNENAGCVNCIETLSSARQYLENLAKEGGTTTAVLLKDKGCRNEMIRNIRRQSTLSLKEIGILFDGLSESTISKILNS